MTAYLVEFAFGVGWVLLFDRVVFPRLYGCRWRLGGMPAGFYLFCLVFDSLLLSLGFFFGPLWTGMWTTIVLIDFYGWWDSDDAQRRRKRVFGRLRVQLRSFAPSPIPSPAVG